MIFEDMDNYDTFEGDAQKMLDALDENPQPDERVAFKNIFGYLFAKAIERAYNEQAYPEVNGRLKASYCPYI